MCNHKVSDTSSPNSLVWVPPEQMSIEWDVQDDVLLREAVEAGASLHALAAGLVCLHFQWSLGALLVSSASDIASHAVVTGPFFTAVHA